MLSFTNICFTNWSVLSFILQIINELNYFILTFLSATKLVELYSPTSIKNQINHFIFRYNLKLHNSGLSYNFLLFTLFGFVLAIPWRDFSALKISSNPIIVVPCNREARQSSKTAQPITLYSHKERTRFSMKSNVFPYADGIFRILH